MIHRRLAIIRRGVFTVLSVLSLLLCVPTVAPWRQSYHEIQELYFDTVHDRTMLKSVRGHVELLYVGLLRLNASRFYDDSSSAKHHVTTGEVVRSSGDPSFSSISFLGFGGMVAKSSGWKAHWGIWFPHWFLAFVFAILPALHLRTTIRALRPLTTACS